MSQLAIPTVSIANDTSTHSSSNDATIFGAVGGVVLFLFIAVLCVIAILFTRHYYNKKKAAYRVSNIVHYKATAHGSDVSFYPNLCYDTVCDHENNKIDTVVYNDYNVIPNSATNAGRSNNKIDYVYV